MQDCSQREDAQPHRRAHAAFQRQLPWRGLGADARQQLEGDTLTTQVQIAASRLFPAATGAQAIAIASSGSAPPRTIAQSWRERPHQRAGREALMR